MGGTNLVNRRSLLGASCAAPVALLKGARPGLSENRATCPRDAATLEPIGARPYSIPCFVNEENVRFQSDGGAWADAALEELGRIESAMIERHKRYLREVLS